ncbi:MAG: ABC transporter permease [Ignavibacteriales bacterium]|nr:ABC transporter permease [Ignavibacteriales bacterium]
MKISELFRVAFTSLVSNKLRSILTILGIVVGIFCIIAISTVIAMLKQSIKEGVGQLDQNSFQIQKWPAVQTGGPGEGWRFRNRKDILIEDYYKLKEKLIDAQYVGAEQWGGGKIFKYKNKETNPNIQLCGGTTEAFPNNKWYVDKGRAINESDIESSRRVVVLGSDVAKTLFEYMDPVGQEVKVDGFKLTVIGVLEEAGAFFGQSQGNFAVIPITTYQNFYGKRTRSINITVMVKEGDDYNAMIEKAEGIMRTIRKVPPTEENDFDIWTNESILAQINDIMSGVWTGAIVISAISLLIAGVGIMSIMLVTVTERTKEIGIRKAIGAKKRNILVQFVLEAITLCLVGGFVGMILGYIAGTSVGSLLDATTIFPMDEILIGVSLCVIIGVVFGTYPAMKAANLDPIEALRYE